MSFYNNFTAICNTKNLSLGNVCKACGLSDSIHSKWKDNKSLPKIDAIIKLTTYLNCSADKLLLGKDPENTPEHQKLISLYDKLSIENKEMSFGLLEAMYDVQTKNEYKKNNKTITITHSLLKASAGTGYSLYGDGFEDIEILDTPEVHEANFALTIEGDSMYPDYCDGDVVLVKHQSNVGIGQVGIFIINNSEGYIKEYGTDYLISRNPKCDNVIPKESDEVKCWGLVIGKATVIE